MNKSRTIFHFPFEIFHLSLPERVARALVSWALVKFACFTSRRPISADDKWKMKNLKWKMENGLNFFTILSHFNRGAARSATLTEIER